MKFNWGTGIIIAFVCFISFIMFFVVNMNINKKYDHDLVTEDYYKQELEYQNDINKESKAKNLVNNVTVEKNEKGLLIVFPEDFEAKDISGKVILYRPSNKHLDFEMPISLINDHNLIVPNELLLSGRWNIKIDWTYKEDKYMFKKLIVF